VKEFLSRQYPNFFLWSPFVFGTGIATYFALPFEPYLSFPFLFFAITVIALIIFYKYSSANIVSRILIISLLLSLAGFFYATGFTQNRQSNLIPHDMRGAEIIGTVRAIDYTDDRVRLFINNATIIAADGSRFYEHTPRITIRPDYIAVPGVGDKVHMMGSLFRPGTAASPNAFDFSEWAFFNNIDAVGFATEINVIEKGKGPRGISHLRDVIRNNVARHDNVRAVALSESLMLGYRRALPQEDLEAARISGIVHVFSISGFHLMLVGGWIYLFFYLILRLIPHLTRRIPVRNIAIIPTIITLGFYMLLSGANTPTIRAFIMATIGFLALVYARNIFSMRSASIAMFILLLYNPYFLLSAGFQLSFAAVYGILWIFRDRKYIVRTRAQRFANGAWSVAKIDIISTIFTATFIAFHFYHIPIYSLIGNILCLPLFAFLIMPLVLLGTLSAQVGIFLPLDLAAHVYDLVRVIIHWITTLPHASVMMPKMSGFSLSLLVLAMASWVFIVDKDDQPFYKQPKYIIVVCCLIIALCSLFMRPRPVFYSSADNILVAFRQDDGTLQFNRGRSAPHRLIFGSWEQSNWQRTPDVRTPIRRGFDGERFTVLRTNDNILFYKTPNWNLAYVWQFVPLVNNINELCADKNLDFIVAPFDIDAPNCHAEILRGAFVIYESGRVQHVRNNRIWHR